jgi:hypothetical protein
MKKREKLLLKKNINFGVISCTSTKTQIWGMVIEATHFETRCVKTTTKTNMMVLKDLQDPWKQNGAS